MKHLVLLESIGALPIQNDDANALTSREADELERYISAHLLEPTCFQLTRHSLRIINYVGYIQLSTASIEVLPKISAASTPEECRVALLRMLHESGYLSVSLSDLSSQNLTLGNLYEIFGRLFAESLLNELRRGLSSCYQSAEDHITFLRGKLLLNKHVGNILRGSSRVACAYEEFQVDHLLNQFLKQVVRLLLQHVKHLHTLNLLSGCLLRMDDVQDTVLVPDQVESIHLDRTNRRFETVLLLAKMFYHNQVSTMRTGIDCAFSLLFPMNELFELYVARVCQKYLPYRVYCQASQAKLWVNSQTGRGIFTLKPDMIIEPNDAAQIIFDTKWKWISGDIARHGVTREDYYQMYAYLTRYSKACAAVLLYPHHEKLANHGTFLEQYHLEAEPGKLLIIASVALGDKLQVATDVKNLVEQLSTEGAKAQVV